jgi:tight adherence protein B
VVIVRSRARTRRTVEQERYAVEAISGASRALRAGIPLGGMLEILAVEGRGEAGRAFREIIRRESLGEDLASAIRRVLLRSPLPALRAFGLAVIVQINAGGDLADTTDRLARSLVERGRMRRRARTIVSYSRAAATVLSVLPILAVPLMAWLVDDYLTLLLDRPAGNILLAVSAVLLVAGIASIQRFGRIDGAGRPA